MTSSNRPQYFGGAALEVEDYKEAYGCYTTIGGMSSSIREDATASAYFANMKLLNQLMMQKQQQQQRKMPRSSSAPLSLSHQQLLTGAFPPQQQRGCQSHSASSKIHAHSSSDGPSSFVAGNTKNNRHHDRQAASSSSSPVRYHPAHYQQPSNMFDTLSHAVFLTQTSNNRNTSTTNHTLELQQQHQPHTVFHEEVVTEEEDEDDDGEAGEHHLGFDGDDDENEEGSPSSADGNENRFRHYQADQWTTMLEDLIAYRRQYGHCNVPHTSKELPALGRWVKRQRYQYKLMQEGKKESTMTPERALILEQVGFVWDAHNSTWHRRFQELHAFFLSQGHTNVPSNFPPNPQLSTWVKFQRRQYKALRKGSQNRSKGASGQSLTPVRIRALEDLGFQWELRHIQPQHQEGENGGNKIN